MGLSTEEYRKGLGKKESFLISSFSRDNKLIFTTEEAKAIIGEDAKNTIYQLVKKKWVLQLKKGLYIVVPLIDLIS